jgi:integrase
LQEVNRKVGGDFVDHLSGSLGPRTVNKYLTGLSTYWSWLLKRGHLKGANPWHNQRLKPPKLPKVKRQRAFGDNELETLFGGDPSPRLHDFMVIAALSGMRLHEIGDLTVGDCANGFFDVREAKTEAGVRNVPIHPRLRPLIHRRSMGKPLSVFLFHELPQRGEHDLRKRAAPVSQEFGRHTRRLGVAIVAEGTTRSLVDFHSFRRWFITQAERAHQPKHIIEAVVGHERGSLALDVYSAGPAPDQLRACVEAVNLPPAVYSLLAFQ